MMHRLYIYSFIAACLSIFSYGITGAAVATRSDQVFANGTPYVWGGNSLESGIDCSGLVKEIFAEDGKIIPRTAATQATETDGCPDYHDLYATKLGDTLYFKNASGKIHHVAIVTGHTASGLPIITHAKGKNYGVVKEVISQHYISELYTIKRFAECDVIGGAPKKKPEEPLMPDYHTYTEVAKIDLHKNIYFAKMMAMNRISVNHMAKEYKAYYYLLKELNHHLHTQDTTSIIIYDPDPE